jgi:hypothetical protein
MDKKSLKTLAPGHTAPHLHDDPDPGHLTGDADGRRRRQRAEERKSDGAIDGRQ